MPFPSFSGCTGGEEGVSKESHPFERPFTGALTVELSGFVGDWDLFLLDSNGTTITSSKSDTAPFEIFTAPLRANQPVTIVACNWQGGPSATVEFSFVRAPVVSVGDVTVHEGDAGTRHAVFGVSLSEPWSSNVRVSYATVNTGGGAGPGDYKARSGTLTLLAGTTDATVKVAVAGDTTDEGDETFGLDLSSPTGAIVGDGIGVGTILDDDPDTVTQRLGIGDVKVHEGDSGARSAILNVSLSHPSTSTVAVSFATVKGTATGTDITAKSGSLSFAPGTTSLNVKVPITPDTAVEGDESFTVTLSNPGGATISDGTGVVTIVDND